MYRQNYERARFHIQYGPASLFERVRFRMKDVHVLFPGKHYQQRARERQVPDEVLAALCQFDCGTWELRTAEVRTDRGKFVSSGWETEVDGHRYLVSIGVGNYIKTIYRVTGHGAGQCVRAGELYDFVDRVNRQLMEEDLALLREDASDDNPRQDSPKALETHDQSRTV